MRLVIAILVLASALSAQVVCYPVDPKGKVDLTHEAKNVVSVGGDPISSVHLFVDFAPTRERCYEYLGGTIALNSGKIVHSFWVEVKPYEQWMSDADSCSSTRTKEPLVRFRTAILERPGAEPEKKSLSIPREFCRTTDY